MSRLSEKYLQELEDDFIFELGYQEWLRENMSEPTEYELDEMEQDYLQKQSHFTSNRIITHKSLNNPNYQPTKEQL